MNDTRVAELLDELTPRYDDCRGDWERVVASDGPRSARHPAWLAVVAAAAIAVAAVLVLAWPFHEHQGPLLDRALAAVGDGPVFHVVLRGEWGGTLVDLRTGKRSPVYGDNEIWFDTTRGREHTIERLGGVVQNESLSRPSQPPDEFVALGREYRKALEAGTARVAGEGTIDGRPVVWITIRSWLLPDVADGKDHAEAEQVAVSKQTFRPVALRATRDGKQAPDTEQRVIELDFVSHGDFTASAAHSLEGKVFKQGREPIALEQAPGVLGRAPLWLGREYAGFPLAQAFRETTAVGRRPEIRLKGSDAAAALRCSKLRGAAGGRCFRKLGLQSVEVRPDGLFTSGPTHWSDELTSVVLFYGTVGDDPSTFRKDTIPLIDRPYVTVTESTQVSPLRRGAGSYVPPAGSVFVLAGGRTGVLQLDGLQVTIDAGSEDAVLAAAHAIEAMPG